ncbi:pilin N-terminal domain-containing protein [Lacticaseibacillus jixianensis]|uniref:Pilin N-terminal domain-containing protein n=1 Tax=Lacticaseibacillus jixianensis TaxID=2486012 RepID=A0ABW4BBN4_9LACO|nr:pilin N-terminal domain-containing protein [Lacticaseibacillus jixianensis]
MVKQSMRTILLAGLALLGLAAAAPQPVHAGTVIIQSMRAPAQPAGAAQPVPGLTFTAYDVTQAYWALGGGPAVQEAVAAPAVGKPLGTSITDASGVARFTGLVHTAAGRLAVYKFAQTAGPAGFTSQVMVASLPASGVLRLWPKSAARPPLPDTGGPDDTDEAGLGGTGGGNTQTCLPATGTAAAPGLSAVGLIFLLLIGTQLKKPVKGEQS